MKPEGWTPTLPDGRKLGGVRIYPLVS